jgi:maleate isomerase
MSLGFGHRARIGHLYPSGGLCDFEIQSMAPEGVQFVTTRLPFKRTGLEDDSALVADVETHAGLLADAAVDLIAMNCTAASMAVGAATINQRIEAVTGIAATTTTDAVLDALSHVGAKRIALMTPYPRAVVEMEMAFLGTQGIEVVAERAFACTTPVQQGEIAPEVWLERALQLDLQGADALLISCAGIQLSPVLGEIEARLDKPVIASNAALLWKCLRALGLAERPTRYGRLLAGEFDAPRAR